MTCRQVQLLISEYLSAELPDTMRGELERHAQDCQHCSEEIRAFRQTIRLARQSFAEFDEHPISPTLLRRIKKGIIPVSKA